MGGICILRLNKKLLEKFISEEEFTAYQHEVKHIDQQMKARKTLGAQFLGWLEEDPKKDCMLKKLYNCQTQLNAFKPDVLIVIGIGGSYLGTRAIDDALSPYFNEDSLEIIYAGFNLSGSYITDLLHYIKNKSVVLNVISKSGSTTETAISFRILENYMTHTYGKEAKDRIIITTDAKAGLLKEIAITNDYTTLNIPDDIGGRFSVFTPVGLFPLLMRGHQVEDLLAGESKARKELSTNENQAYDYAIIRHILGEKGYVIELLASFEPKLKYVHEWWKQLFGESEGKERKGIFPAAVSYSTDLHSIGQYVQDGQRILFETLLNFKQVDGNAHIPKDKANIDQLNEFTNQSLNEMNQLSLKGTKKAHYDGGVPVIQIDMPALDAYHLGYLLHFFMKACSMSAYLLKVNPFDQPGVEAYKKETMKLLKKNASHKKTNNFSHGK